MTQHQSSGTRQYSTHAELVGGPSAVPAEPRALDAIIVPAARPAINLEHAIDLARSADTRLVVLCSREARAAEVNKLLSERSFSRAIAIDLPYAYKHPLLNFATSAFARRTLPRICAVRPTDLSNKRNIGLILARLLQWQRIFFMDDDIRKVGLADLHSTVSMLGQYRTVGMLVNEFPDNSVVCHAHRQTGEYQGVNISGSVLAVDCTDSVDFFPNVYNEDWLFFCHDAATGRLGSSGLNATQLRYDPFANTRRAVSEEFGDVLAEGIYALLHQHGGTVQAPPDYWANFLDARKIFLQAIIDRRRKAPVELRQKINRVVTAAFESSAWIRPEHCVNYVNLWMQDRHRWQQRLGEIDPAASVEAALKKLDLSAAGDLGEKDDFIQWEDEIPAVGPPDVTRTSETITLSESWPGDASPAASATAGTAATTLPPALADTSIRPTAAMVAAPDQASVADHRVSALAAALCAVLVNAITAALPTMLTGRRSATLAGWLRRRTDIGPR